MPVAEAAPPAREAYPPRLAAAESALVAARRAQAGVADRQAGGVGLALSGGGIRSATFCLGVLQALARGGLIRRIDFLSTVSGGGYCGGFLGALICRPAMPGDTRSGVARAEAELVDLDSRLVKWLREHGRYLSPNGSGDEWLAVAGMLRNWVAVQTVLLAFVAAVVTVLVAIRVLLQPELGRGAVDEMILWSPFWAAPIACLVSAVPFAWAYWMAPRVNPKTGALMDIGPLRRSAVLAVVFGAAGLGYWAGAPAESRGRVLAWILLIAFALLVVAAAVLAGYWFGVGAEDPPRRDRLARSGLTRGLALMLKLAGATALLALIDSLGATLYVWMRPGGFSIVDRLAGAVGIGGALTVVRWLLNVARRADGTGRVSLPIGLVAGVAAVAVGGAALVGVSALVHAVAWDSLLWPADAPLYALGVLLAISTLLSILFGWTMRFVNDSSQQALYGARLARAYLGASNPNRQTGAGRRITDPIRDDDLALTDYATAASGGPLHLINVTLNETVSGESQIEHRDRKGLALAVGPAGLSAGVRHHALWGAAPAGQGPVATSTDRIEPVAPTSGYRAFVAVTQPPAEPEPTPTVDARRANELQAVEPLSVATWVAISGAAVAPGLGAKTSLGFSLLLTVFNVRLGYWWDSRIAPRRRREKDAGGETPRWIERQGERIAWLLPVQTYLFYEMLGRFYGPNRQHWYLTDGGHFENTGAYELIRRRVPFIIVCDAGQDGDFDFADVANLVRKARTDFQAEISFVAAPQIRDLPAELQPLFGVPADFAPLFVRAATGRAVRDPAPRPRPCAMLARVDYDGRPAAPDRPPDTVILFLKPSLAGAEPEDVLHYAQEHADFPHESTGDQYFDEAQWESYRMLGDWIASRVFASRPEGAGGWTPAALTPPIIGA